MSVLKTDLTAQVAREMGDTDINNLTYTNDQLMSSLDDGCAELNRRGYKTAFTVAGAGDAAYISPSPAEDEKRLIVLCSALVLTEGEIQKSARNAIIHQNVAGRTDLTRVAEWLLKIRDKLEEQIIDSIDSSMHASNSIDNDGDTVVEGHELQNTPQVQADNYGEGLVRTEIITGI